MSSDTSRTSRPDSDAKAYWRAHLRIMSVLLLVWAAGSYGLGIFLATPLDSVRLGGFPLGFWFAQQGSIYLFVLLILIYALWMDRLDRHHGVD
jgi:putative solute:sodium symporter small subunit